MTPFRRHVFLGLSIMVSDGYGSANPHPGSTILGLDRAQCKLHMANSEILVYGTTLLLEINAIHSRKEKLLFYQDVICWYHMANSEILVYGTTLFNIGNIKRDTLQKRKFVVLSGWNLLVSWKLHVKNAQSG